VSVTFVSKRRKRPSRSVLPPYRPLSRLLLRLGRRPLHVLEVIRPEFLTPEFHRDARPGFQRLAVDEVSGGDVLDPDPQRFEQRDLTRRFASLDPAEHEIPDLAANVVVADRALLLRRQEVAGFVERRLAPVD